MKRSEVQNHSYHRRAWNTCRKRFNSAIGCRGKIDCDQLRNAGDSPPDAGGVEMPQPHGRGTNLATSFADQRLKHYGYHSHHQHNRFVRQKQRHELMEFLHNQETGLNGSILKV